MTIESTGSAPPTSAQEETGTNKILGEIKAVVTAEVDSVGGAKPEPEERPFIDAMKLAPNQQAWPDGSRHDTVNSMVVTQTMNVNDVLDSFGLQCGNCLHWDWPEGQEELARIAVMGSPEEKQTIRELRAQLLETGTVDARPDFVPVGEVFFDETDKFIRQMGMCKALSDMTGELELLHPSQNACPSQTADGTPIPLLYKAKDSAQEKRDKEARDRLLAKAARKVK